MEKVCRFCGKTFETHDNRRNYCSAECAKKAKLEYSRQYKRAKRQSTTKICKICGREFRPATGKYRYCSAECAKRAQKVSKRKYRRKYKKAKRQERKFLGLIGPVNRICSICGEPFVANSPNQKYCSEECLQQARKLQAKKTQLKKICVVCGKEFITQFYSTKTCSPECSSILRRKPANSALKTLGKNKVIEVPNEELKVRVKSLTDDYKFTTLRQAVNFLSVYSSVSTEECIDLLRERKTEIDNYKIFYE